MKFVKFKEHLSFGFFKSARGYIKENLFARSYQVSMAVHYGKGRTEEF
jgi:hypothetical protein